MSDSDKSACTLVSLIPFELREEKPGVFPSLYVIPSAKEKDFELLIIEEATSTMYVGLDKGNIVMPLKAEQVAKAIVRDYCIAQLAYADDAMPGLFWVYGRQDKKSILIEHAKELAEARRKQINWFMALTRMADDDWAKHRRHATISRLQRFACNSLKMVREWANEPKQEDIKNCPGCMTQVHPLAVICAACRTVIDPEAYKKLQRAG